MYKGLDSSLVIKFPYRSVWNLVTSKNRILRIGSYVGKVLTFDQFKRRGMIFTNRCFLCENDKDTIDHLMIHCKKVKMLWNLFLSIVRAS